MAVIAHAGRVSHVCCSADGQSLFTASASDSTVHMWTIAPTVLTAGARLGGEGVTPFLNMMEGGGDGQLFADMKEYFYYSQLQRQGLDSMEARVVSDLIPLSQVGEGAVVDDCTYRSVCARVNDS